MTTLSAPTVAPERRTSHLRVWFVLLSVVALIVGLGAGFVVGRVTKADTVLPSDLAGTTTTQLLKDLTKACSSGDASQMVGYFAPDATFTDTTKTEGYVMTGRTRIAEALASLHGFGFQWILEGTAIQHGEFVAQYDTTVGPAMAVFQIKNDKVQNVWIVRP